MTNGFHPKADEKLVEPAKREKSASPASRQPPKEKADGKAQNRKKG